MSLLKCRQCIAAEARALSFDFRLSAFCKRWGTMPADSEKQHLSLVICSHVDSGKSTTAARLVFELAGHLEHELKKLKQEAERLGKGSFALCLLHGQAEGGARARCDHLLHHQGVLHKQVALQCNGSCQ